MQSRERERERERESEWVRERETDRYIGPLALSPFLPPPHPAPKATNERHERGDGPIFNNSHLVQKIATGAVTPLICLKQTVGPYKCTYADSRLVGQ